MILDSGEVESEMESLPVRNETPTPREIELKFVLEPGSERALLQHPLLRDRIGGVCTTVSTYYDTRKSVLRSAGVSLRVRQLGNAFVQTVKSDPGATAGLFDRWEWEESISGPDPELDRVAGMAAPLARRSVRDKLRPVFKTLVGRRSCTIERDGSRIEVVVDAGEVVAGDRRLPLLELELELLDGSPRALFALARELDAQVPLRIGVLTKSEQGQRLASGRARHASKADPVRLSRTMSAPQAFQAIAFSCIRQFHANEPLVLAARDVDALHQCRVALRRLRSSFSLFRPLLPDPERARFGAELRTLAAVLGEARNLDVLLRRRSESLSQDSRRSLMEERGKAYDRAIEALRSPPVRAMLIDLVEWVSTGTFPNPDARPTPSPWIEPFSAKVLDRFWKKVKRRGTHLLDLGDEARHELRIAGKKLRYAGEFFADLYGGQGVAVRRNAFLAELERIQDKLGDLNDLVTERELETRLARLGVALPPHRDGVRGVERQELIASADRAFRRLAEVGPFWR